MEVLRSKFKDYKRIVVKIGTSNLTYSNGRVNINRIDKLVRVLSDILNQGKEVVLVTSGAIGVGVGKLNLKKRPKSLEEKQALAAIGQSELMHIYSRLFADYSHITAQILLTRGVIEDDISRRNIVNTFENLFKLGVIPIVNENDTVSSEELEYGKKKLFGDNDTLSVYVAKIISADMLILLTDIDGFYDCDPRGNSCAKLISVINEITPEMEMCAGGNGTSRGTGGMATKISAAKVAIEAGIAMIIVNGNSPDIIYDVLNGESVGSLFAKK